MLLKDFPKEVLRIPPTLVLPYQKQLQLSGLRKVWSTHLGSVIPQYEFRIAWSVQPNLLRRLYRLNWPMRVINGTGFG